MTHRQQLLWFALVWALLVFGLALSGCAHGKPNVMCSVPQMVILEDSASPRLIETTRVAVALWNAAVGVDVLVFAGTGWEDLSYTHTVVSVEQTPTMRPGGLGLNISHWRGRCITGSAIYVYDKSVTDDDLLLHVVMHELGHALGLGHEPTGFMSAAGFHPPEDLEITKHSIMQLRSVYGGSE